MWRWKFVFEVDALGSFRELLRDLSGKQNVFPALNDLRLIIFSSLVSLIFYQQISANCISFSWKIRLQEKRVTIGWEQNFKVKAMVLTRPFGNTPFIRYRCQCTGKSSSRQADFLLLMFLLIREEPIVKCWWGLIVGLNFWLFLLIKSLPCIRKGNIQNEVTS